MTQDLTEHLRGNREQLDTRRAMGDQLAVPRAVDHLAFFRRKADARRAAVSLEQLGFRTHVGGGIMKSALRFTRVETLDIESVTSFVTDAFDVVSTHGGNYDGWGAEVADEAPAPALPALRAASSFVDTTPAGVPRGQTVFVLDYASGQFVGRSRNTYRRLQSHARTAHRYGRQLDRQRWVDASGKSRVEMSRMLQQTMNALRLGEPEE